MWHKQALLAMTGKKVFHFIFMYKSYSIHLPTNLHENESKGENKHEEI